MGKPVLLTRRFNNQIIKEKCLLVSDDDPIYTFHGDTPGPVISEKTDTILGTVFDVSNGMVMFEDEHGIFGIHPDNVVRIKVLSSRSQQLINQRRTMRNHALRYPRWALRCFLILGGSLIVVILCGVVFILGKSRAL